MGNLRRHAAAVLTVLGIVGSTSLAKAEVLATATRTADFSTLSNSPVPVPLDDTGSTTLAFSTSTNNQKVVITYNAECEAVGNAAGKYLSVSILVDGHPTNPNSGTDFALCASVSANTYVWTGAVRQSVYVVPTAGAHKVTVVATGVSTYSWRLDDTSLVVAR